MDRRNFMKASGALAAVTGLTGRKAGADVADHLWEGYDFGPGPRVTARLNQGPFGIEQDEGWFTIASTTPSRHAVRNRGVGLIGYTWEEGGPSLAARKGLETLEQHVEKMASLPFVDVLYIRCDWRDVQSRPGKLDLHSIWKLTYDAAKAHDLRVGFRVQLSSPDIQPQRLSLPDFLRDKVPLVNIGRKSSERRTDFDFYEPRYDHPEFQKAFRDLNELLAVEFDGHPRTEFMDLMMYGFWGEGHTNDYPNPLPDYLTAERTMIGMTRLQLETWRKTPLVVNTQPDISRTGNREVHDLAVRAGGWLRSDSLLMDEPIQIEMLAHRPPWLAVVLEEGRGRHYLPEEDTPEKGDYPHAIGGPLDRPFREASALHALDVGANYWSLWTEADNLRRFHEKYPESLTSLQQRLGYRVRPSWVWQRKRYGTSELILGIVNDGVAGVPGSLGVFVESPDGKVKIGGSLDSGCPHAGKVRQASFVLPAGMDGQLVVLRAEVEIRGVRHPVRWACAQPTNPDGSLSIRLKKHSDADWRKGV
jgi:hypothetical protein